RSPDGVRAAVVRLSLLDLRPQDARLVGLAVGSANEDCAKTWTQVLHLHEAARKRGGEPEAPQMLFLDPASATERYRAFGRIALAAAQDGIRFDVRPAESIDRDMETLQSLLRVGAARGEETHILCDNAGQL